MAWQPENSLERSLMRAAEDPAHRPQFYRNLAESNLFIIQHGPPPDRCGTTVLKEGYQLKIQHIDHNGKPYIPVFSSLIRLQQVLQEEAGYVALNALEFMKITQGAEMLLNPGSDFGKEFTREEIQSIVDGSIWKPSESYLVEKETQVMVGQPANYPRELADTLGRLFRRVKEVKRAYLAHFFNPEQDEKPHTLIGIEVSGNWDHVVSQAGLVARDVQIPDPPVDFIQITGKGGVEDYFLNECEPFYKRKILGLF
jgi:hypothetical protein